MPNLKTNLQIYLLILVGNTKKNGKVLEIGYVQVMFILKIENIDRLLKQDTPFGISKS